MSADQLSELVLELYDVRKEAKEYLEYWLNPDPKKWLEKAEKDAGRIFYVSSGNPRRRPSLSDLNTIVKHFLTFGMDREQNAEFLLYVAETECGWLEQRWRRMTYRTSMLKNLENARLYIENAFPDPDKNPYALRLERLTERVNSLFLYT